MALACSPMDALAGLLDGPRARSAFLLRSSVDPPWSMRIEDQAPLTVLAMVRGDAWVLPESGDPVCLSAGDVAVFRGPDSYTVADDPSRAPQVAIHPGQVCEVLNPDGESLVASMAFGVRTWGNAFPGRTEMLTGTYQLEGEVSGRLLQVLPSLFVLREDEWRCPVVPLLVDEIGKDEPGQETVLDRLLDLLLISALRAWFTRSDDAAPTWFQAHGDPIVGRALRLMHHNPAHPWTVSELARESAISRAAFARRFQELVGEPPVAFLTGWRIALAADLLREPGATLSAVAHQVGYGSPFALSTAFKRLRGISPQQYMRRERLLGVG
ncbi:MAG: AraC-type DNA-binding protein-like protein [Mycobacterium sp.]|nr:AraC-type DNA-binding protein-like protein [Mycobacterium sp.]